MNDSEVTYGSYRLEVRGELSLKGPMHIGSGERLGVVTDDPILRFANEPDGAPFIPGSSLRGVLRSRLRREQTQIGVAKEYYDTFFGEAGDEKRSKLGRLGRLRVFDSLPVSPHGPTQIRDHARHSPRTGAAEDGAKFDREVVSPTRYGFRAIYYGEGPGDREIQLLLAMVSLLENGWVHVGAKRGLDYGRLQLCNVSWLGEQRRDPQQLASYLAGRLAGKRAAWRGTSSCPIRVCACRDEIKDALEPESVLRVGLRLQCKGPVLIKAAFAKSVGTVTVEDLSSRARDYGTLGHILSDALFVERDDTGRPYLPAESLRGVLRTQAFWVAHSIECAAQGKDLGNEPKSFCQLLFGSRKERTDSGSAGLFRAGDGDLVDDPHYCYLDHVAVDRIVQSAVDEKKFDTCGLESPVFQTSFGVVYRRSAYKHVAFFVKLIRDVVEGQLKIGSGTTRGFGTICSAQITDITLDLANDFVFDTDGRADTRSWYARRILQFRQPCWADLKQIATDLKPIMEPANDG